MTTPPLADKGIDVAGALALIATAYKELERESRHLKQQERDRQRSEENGLRLQSEDAKDASAPAKASRGSVELERSPAAVAWSMARTQSKFKILAEERLSRRCQFQAVIANLDDAEEQGAWASGVLSVEDCERALRDFARSALGGGVLCTVTLKDIVTKFEEYCRGTSPRLEPTRIHFINLTDPEKVAEVFGEALVYAVAAVQDALMDQVTHLLVTEVRRTSRNSLLSINGVVSTMRSPSHLRSWVMRQSRHTVIEAFGTCLVILNTAFLGASVDGDPNWKGWDIISLVFACLFAVELIVRITLVGSVRAFFMATEPASDKYWNMFDTVVTSFMFTDVITVFAEMPDTNVAPFTVARMLRLLRITRMARLARSGLFSELFYMVRSVQAGLRTLFWALVLLLIVSYILAVIATMTVGSDRNTDFAPTAEHNFGSVLRSMQTLFGCFTGDCTTFDGQPLHYVFISRFGDVMIPVYWTLVMVFPIGFLNVIVTTFMKNAEHAEQFNLWERQRKVKKERKMVNEMTKLFFDMVVEFNHRRGAFHEWQVTKMMIDRDLWQELVGDEKIRKFLDDHGCDSNMRRALFDKLDADGDGSLSCHELVHGLVDLLRGKFSDADALFPMMKCVSNRLINVETALSALGLCGENPGNDVGALMPFMARIDARLRNVEDALRTAPAHHGTIFLA